MLHPDKLFGRIGNRLFQLAFAYTYSRENGIDFYYQNPKFFEKYLGEIRRMFGSPTPINQIAIHVRRGDYVNNPFYVDLTETSYYQEAMDLFQGEQFIVFSDDIGWCKQQDIFKDCEFSEGNDEWTDLTTMAGCKGIICANSSFSVWAGLLSNAKVVAPKKWYSDGIERTIVPSTWIRK